jgi:4-amino-4-deoxy-L-arabinose transferase-like glycosyltransferase
LSSSVGLCLDRFPVRHYKASLSWLEAIVDEEAEFVLMPLRRPGLALWSGSSCRFWAVLLVLGSALWHLAYLTRGCSLDLAPDEAHYWEWSRHLDWSYYSKGPLVAWLIRLSCDLFGSWSVAWCGTLMPAVRLPAILSGALLLMALYRLTIQVYGRDQLALGVVAAALTLPVVATGSSLMTIDAPFTCCWAWALVLGHRAVFRGSAWAWPATGLVVALGLLAKYTMILWPASLLLFLLVSPDHRALLWSRSFWILVAVSALGGVPILVWNAQHDWVTVRHLFGLSGVVHVHDNAPDWHLLGPLVYLAGQGALLLIFWFVCWVLAMLAHRPGVERNTELSYLWWLSAPTFAVFLVFGLKTGGGEVNWPVTAYLSGMVLTAAWLARQLSQANLWYRRLTQVNLILACGLGLGATFYLHYGERVYPELAALLGGPTPGNPMPLRKIDPTCRLRGWRVLAGEVDAVRRALKTSEGEEPVLGGTVWNLPGELGFYCQGQPPTVSLGPVFGDRHSQYDFWPGPFADPEAYRGRTFVLIGVVDKVHFRMLQSSFDKVEERPRRVEYYERGQLVSMWEITICHGFRSFPPGSSPSTHF